MYFSRGCRCGLGLQIIAGAERIWGSRNAAHNAHMNAARSSDSLRPPDDNVLRVSD